MIRLKLPDIPEGWSLAHLINLDPDWQVAVKNDEHICIATGTTTYQACKLAVEKAIKGEYFGRLYEPQDFSNPSPDLRATLEGMGLLRKRDPAPWIDLG